MTDRNQTSPSAEPAVTFHQHAGHDRPFWPALRRGIAGRCPHCGEGRLFAGYLRQVERCAVFDEAWGEIRADDAPPWATILIVGHLMAPAMIFVGRTEEVPLWLGTVVLFTLAGGLIYTILPRAKGLFIAAIWSRRAGET